MKGKDFFTVSGHLECSFEPKVSKKTRTKKIVERKELKSEAPNVATTLINLIQRNGRYQYNVWIYRIGIDLDFDLK